MACFVSSRKRRRKKEEANVFDDGEVGDGDEDLRFCAPAVPVVMSDGD